MATLNLQDKKITKGTATAIRAFIRENYKSMSAEYLVFYDTVAGLIELQIMKPLVKRMTMNDILSRCYNLEETLSAGGCAGFSVEKVSL